MPAVPEQLLSSALRASAHRVLTALWTLAVVDVVAFVAVKERELIDILKMPRRTLQLALAELRETGLIARARRRFAGAVVRGWELSRAALRAKAQRAAPATATGCASSVAVSEKKRTREDDMKAIARVAARNDGERRIAERLIKAKVPCSEGEWHNIKVHRRVEEMRRDLGAGAGIRAGEVAYRWKMTRGA